ncbi:hypothetical protein O3M35_000839 [Rhynocoris fuscipes]|uniref:Uncharacterized protein n=1 Tax=Rhynocoris fuscipes TaxID=488301 RepID=A0AAW1DNS0_9HEMI
MKVFIFLTLLVAAAVADEARDKRQLLLGSTLGSPLIASPGIIGARTILNTPLVAPGVVAPGLVAPGLVAPGILGSPLIL